MKEVVLMNKTIQELMYKMSTNDIKKYVSKIIGHKVNEIITRVNCGGEIIIISFRHETYAYSNMKIISSNNEINHYLENFETNTFELIK
jgi:hypothetical protein